jgi:DNA repair protein RadA/Sms
VAKAKTKFQCSNCGHIEPKWAGKCPSCGSWNTFSEVVEIDDTKVGSQFLIGNSQMNLIPESIGEVLEKVKKSKDKRLYNFSAEILNTFFGKGLVAGGLTLLAGEPGLGKSTLALQLLRSLWNGQKTTEKPLNLLYITAEESAFELARRSERLEIPKEINIVQSNNFQQIEAVVVQSHPDVVIIDSVQTIYSSEVSSNPGSVTQVSTIASQLLAISKSKNITIILIGHVTKDGQIAGPKTLEHLVDSVCLLESSDNPVYRTLSFSKNRFGSTSNLLLLKMQENGLQIIADPSLALLENIEEGVGVCYGIAMDKDLPLVVEVQALVSNPNFQGEKAVFGRREALGLKSAKLNVILAIAEKYLGLELKNRDIYIQMSGMPKNLSDDSLDLPVLLAILSSLYNKSAEQVLKIGSAKIAKKNVFAGRLTLSGNLRPPTNENERKNTSKKLGFNLNSDIVFGDLTRLL